MNTLRPSQIRPHHVARQAVVYIRTAVRPMGQDDQSISAQRAQMKWALQWGWQESAIQVIDQDVGRSGLSTEDRRGWQRLLNLENS